MEIFVPTLITRIGIKIICKIIPGTAFKKAPARKAFNPNLAMSKPMQINITIPQIRRPIIMAPSKEM